MRKTETAPSPSSLPRLAGLLLQAEDEEELLLELCPHQAVDDEVRGGIHDNEKPFGVSVSRN